MDPFLLILMGSALWYFTSRSSSKAVVAAPVKKPTPSEPKPVIVKVTPASPPSPATANTTPGPAATTAQNMATGGVAAVVPNVPKPADISGGIWVWKPAGTGGNWVWVPYQ